MQRGTIKRRNMRKFIHESRVKKNICLLNLNKKDFDEMCFDIDKILIKENLFLRIYELKDKFRYLFHDNNKKRRLLEKFLRALRRNLMVSM